MILEHTRGDIYDARRRRWSHNAHRGDEGLWQPPGQSGSAATPLGPTVPFYPFAYPGAKRATTPPRPDDLRRFILGARNRHRLRYPPVGQASRTYSVAELATTVRRPDHPRRFILGARNRRRLRYPPVGQAAGTYRTHEVPRYACQKPRPFVRTVVVANYICAGVTP